MYYKMKCEIWVKSVILNVRGAFLKEILKNLRENRAYGMPRVHAVPRRDTVQRCPISMTSVQVSPVCSIHAILLDKLWRSFSW